MPDTTNHTDPAAAAAAVPGLVFEDPPENCHGGKGRARRRELAAIRAALRAKPHHWAIIGTYGSSRKAASAAMAIRQARTRVWRPEGAYEAVSRTAQGEHRVYVRYVGKQNSTNEAGQ